MLVENVQVYEQDIGKEMEEGVVIMIERLA